MEGSTYGLVKLIVVFGGILAFLSWQIRTVKASKSPDEAERRDEDT